MESVDIGIILGIVGIGVSIFFGVSNVTKKINKNKANMKKSFNPKASKNSTLNMNIKDSFNNNQNNGSKD